MAIKKKIGKERQDRYYFLAKDQGYRARSAFKLIQLNSKFGFLENARVLLDLCAAPGGWLQVAAKNMPLSRVIIGVDLVPIRPIPGVKTFQCDITTEKCRSELRSELKTWKVDVVLNDGAPNVGAAWSRDAYNQAELVLHAMHLACDFLVSGGVFVTKIFRSSEYNSLLWVAQQLFESVEATKPQSSRNVSAEIFVVCKGYLAPSKIDPRLFDPKHVFAEIEGNGNATGDKGRSAASLFKPETRKIQRQGYETSSVLLYQQAPISEFIESADPISVLAQNNRLVWDGEASQKILQSPLTTTEIQEFVKDLRVLGKRDLKCLLRWRVAIKPKPERAVEEAVAPQELEQTVEEALESANAAERRLRKKRQERKRRDRLKMQHGVQSVGENLFSPDYDLFALRKVSSTLPDDAVESSGSESESRNESQASDSEEYDRHLAETFEADWRLLKQKSNERPTADFPEPEASYEEENENPLIVKDSVLALESRGAWFSRPEFNCVSESEPESESEGDGCKQDRRLRAQCSSSSEDSSSDSEHNIDAQQLLQDPAIMTRAFRIKRKGSDRLIDESFNKYSDAFDDNAPSWFLDEERKHRAPNQPVTKEAIDLIKQRAELLKTRPIRKVQEYQMRKKNRLARKLETAAKKAQAIVDNEDDLTDKQKLMAASRLLRKSSGREKLKEKKLIIAKGPRKGIPGRPRGISGKYRMVDARMKKEVNAKKRKAAKHR